ncbi:MAG: methylated-DNA--[protein]-cysteine S-methyltransferase [Chloroflexi bacterium]|nr:methylated-DNA--[protein]-cysteine S-methyltransferase [Chloroflexota bacterium]
MSAYYYAVLPTGIGWVGVLASPKGIRRLVLPQPSPQRAVEKLLPEVEEAEPAASRFEELRQRLEAFFAGEPVVFDDALDLEGAPLFFLRAWKACLAIPKGETRSYAWLAARAGNPRGVRAAGQAMAHNPVPIIIPCHRVVATDGGLCGYGGGLPLKQRLLDLERPVRL